MSVVCPSDACGSSDNNICLYLLSHIFEFVNGKFMRCNHWDLWFTYILYTTAWSGSCFILQKSLVQKVRRGLHSCCMWKTILGWPHLKVISSIVHLYSSSQFFYLCFNHLTLKLILYVFCVFFKNFCPVLITIVWLMLTIESGPSNASPLESWATYLFGSVPFANYFAENIDAQEFVFIVTAHTAKNHLHPYQGWMLHNDWTNCTKNEIGSQLDESRGDRLESEFILYLNLI